MNDDLISRSALKEEIKERTYQFEQIPIRVDRVISIIDNAPTVPLPDFKEGYKQAIIDGKTNFSRPQGEWLHPYLSDIACECSNCHIQMPITDYFNFCPNCGAFLKGGVKNDT